MNNIKNICKKMIEDNLRQDVSEEITELLTIAVMAIILNNEEIAYNKLPAILQRINIYAENKSVLEIAHQSLGNYSEDEALSTADASATRSLQIDEETGTIEEHLNLIISLTDIERKNTANMVEKITNGLIHFMRYGAIENNESSIYIKDGISTMTFNKNTGRLRKKHFTLEGGVTQYYTLQALNKLYNFIENEDISDDTILNKFKKEFRTHRSTSYLLPTTVIELLCDDQYFKKLLDESFEEYSGPSQVASYYNDVMHDGSAFSFLSHKVDCCKNENDLNSSIAVIKAEIHRFKAETKKYRK